MYFKMKIFNKKIGVFTLLVMLAMAVNAQKMVYDLSSRNTIFLKAVYNEDPEHKLEVNVDGNVQTIAKGGSLKIDKECTQFVKMVKPELGTSHTYWRKGDTAAEWDKLHPAEAATTQASTPEPKVASNEANVAKTTQETTTPQSLTEKKIVKDTHSFGPYSVSADQIVETFKTYLDKDAFYSSAYVLDFDAEVRRHAQMLKYIKDDVGKEEYIKENLLREYYGEKDAEISRMESFTDSYISNFVQANYSIDELPAPSEYETKLKNVLEEKISERRDVLDRLHSVVYDEGFAAEAVKHLFSKETIVINIILLLAVIGLVGLIVVMLKKSGAKKKNVKKVVVPTKEEAQADIVVRRKTTSILKKQSLDDVHRNPAYLPIDCSEFSADSAVRRIYIKNTCIKDIYNMYAEDLRNPDNPNEDGCMVLGRWVHDEESDEYYVSMEEIVKPGDDAIFKEYELNFGGKIKLKVSERLRRLRRETNLQYDMTCWVHSHPGLGVFFSNADSGVQMQLKHPTHPKFLVAMVVDILTPEQEFGVFTFRHDGSLNSKVDLKRMYSLEELYKWAVESDKSSFKPEDYRNIMRTSMRRIDSHYGIELSNGAIIDMCQMQVAQESGLLAWAHGYTLEKGGKTEYILSSVNSERGTDENAVIGCYINGSHCSIPTIKRIVSNDFTNIKFILFYSTSEDVLTAIPVIDGQISMDANSYGEEKLEELKIWTRRRR